VAKKGIADHKRSHGTHIWHLRPHRRIPGTDKLCMAGPHSYGMLVSTEMGMCIVQLKDSQHKAASTKNDQRHEDRAKHENSEKLEPSLPIIGFEFRV